MTASVPPLLHLLRRVVPDGNSISDGELLRRYADDRDEAAFELLLWRHGGMVWGVCRRVAPDRAAAEDAFQATALALARHAGTVRAGRSLAGWLYRVGYRAALAVRSRRREEVVAQPPDRAASGSDPAEIAAVREVAQVIDAELSRLPDTFRLPFVLCELEGRSNAEAAALLGCPVGTVESRLTRARARLRNQLSRRGVTLAVGALVAGQVPGAVHAAALRTAADPSAAAVAIRTLAARAAEVAGPGHLRAAGLFFAALAALAVGLAVATGPNPQASDGKRPQPVGQVVPTVFARLGSERFRHPGPVFHAAFTLDGKRLATAALGSVSVWEVATGKLLRRVDRPNVPFHRAGFAADGKTLYAVVGPTQDGCELLTFDATSGQQRARVRINKAVYKGAEFSPDGTRLAVSTMWGSGEVVLVDPATGKQLAGVPAFFRGNALTPDGKRLVLAGGNEVVRVVDATTGKQLDTLKPGDRRPEWVRFTAAGAILFGGNNWLERWDPQQGLAVWKDDFLPSGRGLEVSRDGKWVAHVSSSAVTVFDVQTGKKAFRAWENACTSAQFSPDGRTLALTSWWGVVRLRHAATGKPLPQSPDLPGSVGGLIFSPDGRHLAARAGERWVDWDLTRAVANPRPTPLTDFAALAPGGRVAVRPDTSKDADAPAEFVDPASGKRLRAFDPLETGDTLVMPCAFSGDGLRFVASRRSKRGSGGQQSDLGLAVWEVATGKRLAQRPAGKQGEIASAVAPDGKAVAVLTYGPISRLNVWEPDTGRTRWGRDLLSSMPFVAFTRDGSRLVVQEVAMNMPPQILRMPSVPGPHPLLVLDAANGKELMKVNGPAFGEQPGMFLDDAWHTVPNARALSPDGRSVAISGFDGTIYLWELATDRERCRIVHPGPVHDLAFSPDGGTLAAASLAAPVILYDLYGTRARAKAPGER